MKCQSGELIAHISEWRLSVTAVSDYELELKSLKEKWKGRRKGWKKCNKIDKSILAWVGKGWGGVKMYIRATVPWETFTIRRGIKINGKCRRINTKRLDNRNCLTGQRKYLQCGHKVWCDFGRSNTPLPPTPPSLRIIFLYVTQVTVETWLLVQDKLRCLLGFLLEWCFNGFVCEVNVSCQT